jgi:hypothetical protein
VEQQTVNLPDYIVADIQYVGTLGVDDKVNWLINQRKAGLSDAMIRARVEAVLGAQSDADWSYLTQIADEAQASHAAWIATQPVETGPPPPPLGWRYSLITGELVPENASVDTLVELMTDEGLTAEQDAAIAQQAEILEVAELSVEDKVAWYNEQRDTKSEAQIRAEVEAVLGAQTDQNWSALTTLAAQADAPLAIQPPASPSQQPGASIKPQTVTKPIFTPTAAPPSAQRGDQMQRIVGTTQLPADWDAFSPNAKITWFNRNGITISQLKDAGVSDADIAYMRANGYIVGATQPAAQGAGLSPLVIAAAAAALLIGG